MTSEEKRKLYNQASTKLNGLLLGETDTTLKMASFVAVLKQTFPSFYWVGFYRAIKNKDQLIIGPYQGTPACLHIPFCRGVCGSAATSRTTQLVEDVHHFPDHIACDPLSLSEIVIPIINQHDQLVAVLDIDSSELATFDQIDQEMLEPLCNQIFADATYV